VVGGGFFVAIDTDVTETAEIFFPAVINPGATRSSSKANFMSFVILPRMYLFKYHMMQ
jgi:hypothetical protein